MAVNGVNDSAGHNFDSVASIRKQTEAIRQRAAAQRKVRIAEQGKTGLIQDPMYRDSDGWRCDEVNTSP